VAQYRKEAELNYTRLLEVGRREINYQLGLQAGGNKQETPTLWGKLLTWLNDSNGFDSWEKLARILGPLANPARREPGWLDPVEELKEFLQKKEFALNLADPTLELPDNIKPAGQLGIFHSAFSRDKPALLFEIVDPTADGDRHVVRYRGRLASGNPKLVYRPGEELWARLDVIVDGEKGWRLTWLRGRSEVYELEHLSQQAPQLHRGDDLSAGRPAKGVTLTFNPPLPHVPDLIPEVFARR
jgi:hypothetical protein